MAKRSAAQRRATARMIAASRRKRRKARAPKAAARRRRRARAPVAAAPRRRRRRARAPVAASRRRRHSKRRRARAAAPRKAASRRRRRRHRARDRYQDEMTLAIANKNSALGKAWRRSNRKRSTPVKKRTHRRRKGHAKRRKMGRIRRAARRGAKHVYIKRRGGKRVRRRVRRHWVKPHSRKHRHVKGHYSYEANAMENPLSMSEVVVCGLVGILGAGVSTGVDRLLATHELQKDAAGAYVKNGDVYMDAPKKGQSYNSVATDAPMGATRWAAGLGLAILPIVGAHYIKNPMGRTALQSFGFGALIRTGTKGFTDLMASVLKKNPWGQRLYAAEINAGQLAAADAKAAGDPAPISAVVGVAGIRALGVGAGGDCGCKKNAPPPQYAAPPPPPAAAPMGPPPVVEAPMGMGGTPAPKMSPTNGAGRRTFAGIPTLGRSTDEAAE